MEVVQNAASSVIDSVVETVVDSTNMVFSDVLNKRF